MVASIQPFRLPNHPIGVTPERSYHPDHCWTPLRLPELPADQRPEVRRSPPAPRPRKTAATDQRRGEAYMAQVIDNLASMPPGRRNAALNRAAWTFGRWIS